MLSKKVIFLTGATGNMGAATLAELAARSDQYRVKALVLPGERNHPVVERWHGQPGVEFVWGDLRNPEDVLTGVSGADQVLHIGGMVSPAADYLPELTMAVNVGGAQNIVDAIRAQPHPDRIRLVYVGTVAQTGHRAPPIHWGRTGDPIRISQFDNYAVSKTMAEAIIAGSGLKHWVSIRQTGIAHPGIVKIFDPIMFHSVLNAVMEWVTVEDSGRLAANLCEDDVPDSLWRGFYNIGGGQKMRVVNHEFAGRIYEAIGIPDFRRVMEPGWFATRNFHGQWYADSDHLDQWVPFRRDTMDDFVARLAAGIPWWAKVGARLAQRQVRRRLEQLAKGKGGPLYWLEHDQREYIDAYFGSRNEWTSIPGWDRYELRRPSCEMTLLSHGYDPAKVPNQWGVDMLKEAAEFRGGRCLGGWNGNPDGEAYWECSEGHAFRMSPNLYLRGGHWCPVCMFDPGSYRSIAKRNLFLAQVFD